MQWGMHWATEFVEGERSLASHKKLRFDLVICILLLFVTCVMLACAQALNPNYNFSDVAKPYALELLELQDAKQAQGFVLGRLQEQAMQMGSDTGSMPSRVAKMDRWSPRLPSCL